MPTYFVTDTGEIIYKGLFREQAIKIFLARRACYKERHRGNVRIFEGADISGRIDDRRSVCPV